MYMREITSVQQARTAMPQTGQPTHSRRRSQRLRLFAGAPAQPEPCAERIRKRRSRFTSSLGPEEASMATTSQSSQQGTPRRRRRGRRTAQTQRGAAPPKKRGIQENARPPLWPHATGRSCAPPALGRSRVRLPRGHAQRRRDELRRLPRHGEQQVRARGELLEGGGVHHGLVVLDDVREAVRLELRGGRIPPVGRLHDARDGVDRDHAGEREAAEQLEPVEQVTVRQPSATTSEG